MPNIIETMDFGDGVERRVHPIIDSELSTTSENPVQNKVVTTQIQTLTNQVKDMNNVLGAKNLLPYPYYQTTKILSGVTFTDNGDGSITLNGTNTGANTTFIFFRDTLSNFKKINTSFKLLGGKSSPYISCVIDFYDSSNTWISNIVNNNDTPTVFTIPSNAEYMDVFIRCGTNATYSNLTIYPMLYLVSIADDTYAPYSKTNQELTEDTTALLDNTEVNGAVNMLPYPYKRGNEVINGITSVVDSDGVITLNGTAEAATSFIMFERVENKFALPKGSYKAIVKIVSGTYTGTLSHILRATEGGSGVVKVDKSLGEAGIFSISTVTYIGYQINIPSGSVLTNLKLAPMITVSSYNGDYVPYAMSNRELTTNLPYSKIAECSHINWNGINSTNVEDCIINIVIKSTSEGYGADLYIDNVRVVNNIHTDNYYLTYILKGVHTIRAGTNYCVVDMFITPLNI